MKSSRFESHYQRVMRFLRAPLHVQLPRLLVKLCVRYARRQCRGVLHIGAHVADEAESYGNRPVLWIEANPELMQPLLKNISAYPEQRAISALLGDRDGREVDFHIASNKGASSSLLAFGPYATGSDSLWPDMNLNMTQTIRLQMQTLDSLVENQNVDIAQFDQWILDVQGAELMVVAGAACSLQKCKMLTVEVSTVPVYASGVLYPELRTALVSRNFVPLIEPDIAGFKHGDVTFVHRSLASSMYFRLLLSLVEPCYKLWQRRSKVT